MLWRYLTSRASSLLVVALAASGSLHAEDSRAEDSGATLAGLSVEAAIGEFARRGLRVFHSSDLVRASMIVSEEPQSSEPVAALSEILAPHGLMLRPGLNEYWLVVRRPRSEPVVRQTPAPVAGVSGNREAPTDSRPVEQIVVSASRYEIQGARSNSRYLLTGLELEHAPDLGDDAIRTVARLPGMASNGINALANVRGGEIGETLVRLDGLRLYEPFHLKDFHSVFSVIDPRVVSTMDVYTGGFPATFGDRMSGVIDVKTMVAPEDLYHEVSVSFFNSSFLSSGEFNGGRAEWVASVRRSNLDMLYDQFSEQPAGPRYTDVFAKLRFELNDRLSISGNLLRATDDIVLADDVDREEHASAKQTDTYAWIRLDHELDARTAGTTLLARTSIDSLRSGTSEKSGVGSGWLRDERAFALETLTSEWTRVIGARSLLDFGGGITRVSGRYDYGDEAEFDLLFDTIGAATERSRVRRVDTRHRGHQYFLFGTFRVDLSSRLATEYGVRWHSQDLGGKSVTTFSPRIGVRYALADSTWFRASWGRFFQSQGITELQVNDGVTTFFDPQRSDHFVLGLDRRLADGSMLRLEVYQKSMASLRPRFENLLNSRVLLPELKPDRIGIWPESARARGIEVSLEGGREQFKWWGSLASARVEDRVGGIGIARSWDQRLTLNAGFEMSLPDWILSTDVVYRSGWPTTAVALDAGAALPTVAVGPRNGERMPSYASLDVRLSRLIRLDQSRLTVFLEVANLTGRSNPCCIEYEIGDEEEAGQLVLAEKSYYTRIPSLGFTWAF